VLVANWPLLSGRIRGPTSAGGCSVTRVRITCIGARLLSLLGPATNPPLALGLVVAATLIAADSLVVDLLKQIVPGNIFGVVFLLGVLVVASIWGFTLGAMTSLASAVVYVYFHHLVTRSSFLPAEARDAVAVLVFLVVALFANTLAGLARSRAVEANQRRREAEASRDQLSVLAEQQAALRRVATLVTRGVTPTDVFSSVAMELARFLGVPTSALLRYQADGACLLLAAHDEAGLIDMPVGERFSLEGQNLAAIVLRTGGAARIEYHSAAGSTAARMRKLGIRSGVGAPVVVAGRVWGVAMVGRSQPEPLPPDTEARVTEFADMVATAIADAENRAELTASRARIVAAADAARRGFERDLHDGAQQRLVALGLLLQSAAASLPSDPQAAKDQIVRGVDDLAGLSADLREISHGIHPAILSNGGLSPALKTLARRCAVPVELDLGANRRFPDAAEVAAYYVVAEALTNAAKHAHASQVNVHTKTDVATLRLEVRDDGIGGADTGKGSGLTGLMDRVEALGGHMHISSQAGNGTAISVEIPFELRTTERGSSGGQQSDQPG
jgi:signal transduction histidine kinase